MEGQCDGAFQKIKWQQLLKTDIALLAPPSGYAEEAALA